MARQRTSRAVGVNPRTRREAHRQALNKAQAYMSGEGAERKAFERGMMEKLGAVGYGSQQTMDRLTALQGEFAAKESEFRSQLAGQLAENQGFRTELAKQQAYNQSLASQLASNQSRPQAPSPAPSAPTPAPQPSPPKVAPPPTAASPALTKPAGALHIGAGSGNRVSYPAPVKGGFKNSREEALARARVKASF